MSAWQWGGLAGIAVFVVLVWWLGRDTPPPPRTTEITRPPMGRAHER